MKYNHLTLGQIEAVINKLGGMAGMEKFLRGEASDVDVSALLADWQEFYLGEFGLEIDLSGLKIPEKREGFDPLIVVVPGMTPQLLYEKFAKLFRCCKWIERNLDEIVQSERVAKDSAYAVWLRDKEELKNLSASDLKEKGISAITLEERFLYELKFFGETGVNLDVQNVTLCAGSRYSDGGVPDVSWSCEGLSVDRCSPDDRGCLWSLGVVS